MAAKSEVGENVYLNTNSMASIEVSNF